MTSGFRTIKEAHEWVCDEGVIVSRLLFQMQGSRFTAYHPRYPATAVYGWTYLRTVNEMLAAIAEEEASRR